MASSRHWLAHRTPKLLHRVRRPLLLVERLEERELLNGSSLPLPPQEPLVSQQVLALPNPLANLPANGILPGSVLPSGVSQQPVGSLPGQALPSAPELSAGLSWGALPGPIHKIPANSKAPLVNIPLVVGPDQSSTPNGEGYTPAQMQQAYGFNHITLQAGETFNDAGSGQTIAIIDGLNDPYIVSDLQTFDETFNVGGAAHNPTSTGFFKVVNEDGGSTLPPTDNGQVDYGLETSLDVEWAHAMAPGANILLVETNTPSSINDLNTAIEFAARQPGVSVVSMSFGYGEWPTEYYFDNIFTTPLGHQGVSFVTSAGDSGGLSAQYQAVSPNVLSVGGTTLPADASGNPDRALEYGWTDGGGGISFAGAEPAYQLGVQSTGSRTGPDLAYDGDQTTGVAVYDTLYANAFSSDEPWLKVGGTSMGAPQVSSLVAIANQLRVAAGDGTLDGPNQLLPAIYQIAATDPNAFQDITSGNNGYPAGPGYDFATGVGTPNARYLVPDLAAAYATPAPPATLYWTGDVSTNWDTPGNWSTVDPAVTNIQQSILPGANDHVVVDLSGATILHDTTNYDAIRSFTVTAPNVTLDLGAGTLDLSGAGGRGTFQVDQAGDAATMEAGVLKSADVTSGTTLSATFGSNSEYPELEDVRLDGTVNADQSGNNNGIYFQNGLILNGTIHLGGSSDLSSVLLAGYTDPFAGNQDNNPETISGSGTIQLGQSPNGDALLNWGTLGTFSIGPNITVLGGGPGSTGYFDQTFFTGGLDNEGTFEQNGGSLQIAAFGPALYDWEPSGTTGWTNEGTIEATGATLSLLGGWINNGTIGADSASTVYLGNPTYGQLPSSPDAAYYAWSSLGSVTIANGATVVAGGFLTSDQFQSAASIPGVMADLPLDSPSLDGTLDNSPADNPVRGGVLAADVVTGPLQLVGGTVNGGSMTTSGSNDVQVVAATIPYGGPLNSAPLALSGGWLDDLTNDGTVDVTGTVLTLSNVTNSGTVNGTGGATFNVLGTFTNDGTVNVTGTVLTLSNFTNSGAVNGTGGATIQFLGTWDNTNGSISVDSASSLDLGTPASASTDPIDPPALADGTAYALSLSGVGTITVANGATILLGGLMTADQFTAFRSLPGVSIDLSQDTVVLAGWLDDSPADNPNTGGVLAFTTATGAVDLAGALISQGTITSSGTGALNVEDFAPLALSGGWLDNLTNDGTVDVTGAVLTLSNVTNNGTVNGTGGATVQFVGTWDNTNGCISVDSASSLYLGTLASTFGGDPPTLADGSAYAWNLGNVGTIAVADGAVIRFGGLMTADQFTAFRSLPGVSIDLSQDTVVLAGWLDDSPADNPNTGGVLALTSETGPVDLSGGLISQGTITSSGTGALDLEDYGGVDYNAGGVLDSVTNDGTIVTRSYAILWLEGEVTNNGILAYSSGYAYFLPGGRLTNNGTINLTNPINDGTNFDSWSSVVNNGTITEDAAVFTVTPSPYVPQPPPVSLTNTGTIAATDFSFFGLIGGLRNTGTISGSSTRCYLEGTWDNTTGAIRVDSTSLLWLGHGPDLEPNFYISPPAIADGTPYTLNPSQVGTIDVANGANFVLAGLMTTDQFDAFPRLPGVSINPLQAGVYFAGWLDNSPADNPTSHGVLAINASTGPLYLDDGYIDQGKITTSGSNDLEAAEQGFLDGVELDGNLNVSGLFGEGTIIVLNSLTLNGTIDMPGSFGRIGFGYFDDTPETIHGTGTIFLGESGTDAAFLFDLNDAGLTIDSGITIDAGAAHCEFAAEGSTIENLGTVEDNTASSELYTYGISPDTGELYNGLANYSAGTLSGGTWEVANGAVWNIYGFDLTTNAADLSVSGVSTEILDTNANNALAGFTTNTATGNFTAGAGYNFTAPGAFSNAGVVRIQPGASFSTGSGSYSQSAGSTTVDGTLTAANVLLDGGSLDGTGAITGNLTNAALVTPGDAPGILSINGNYTQTAAGALDIGLAGPASSGQLAVSGTATLAGTLNLVLTNGFTPKAGAWFTILTFAARSGDFSTETGFSLSKNKFFVPSYDSTHLTLVLGPGVTVVAGTDLYIIGGLASNDQVQIKPIGSSNTGSTGVQVTAELNGASTTTTLSQVFGAIYVFGFAGNDTISLAATLTMSSSISAGNGNDNVSLGNGSNTVTLGNGNDHVRLGNGDNTVSLGNGNDNTTVGNGNNVVVEGNGNDSITAGNGDNLIVAGLGHHSVQAGSGSNILIDGSVKLTQSGDSLRQVLDDWEQYGALAADVASIRSRLSVTYNTSNANTLDTGSGLDWFWYTYAKDKANRKPTDLLN